MSFQNVVVSGSKFFLPRINNRMKVFAGEEGGAGEGGSGAGSGQQQPPPATPPKTFTQAEMDAAIDKRFKKEKESNERLTNELKTFRDREGTSVQEKEAFQTRINELEALTLSKEDLAKKEQERISTAAKKVQDGLTGERDMFKGLYTESQIESALGSAASDPEVKALSPKQVVMLLKSQTRLVQKDVGGKAKFEVLVDWTETDKEGVSTQVQIPAKEALKRMKEQPAVWGNLFESDAKGGLGGNNIQQGGSLNPASYSSFDAYKKNRTQIVNQP